MLYPDCSWITGYSEITRAVRRSDFNFRLADNPENSSNRHNRVRYLGLSNVSPQQFAEAITEMVCVQNFYSVAHRTDDGFIDGSRAISN